MYPPQYAPPQSYPPPQYGQQQYGGPPVDPSTLPATPKQQGLLQKYGYDANVSKAAARQIIDALKANGWRRPDAAPPQQFAGPAQYQPANQYAPPQPQHFAIPPQVVQPPYNPATQAPPPQYAPPVAPVNQPMGMGAGPGAPPAPSAQPPWPQPTVSGYDPNAVPFG